MKKLFTVFLAMILAVTAICVPASAATKPLNALDQREWNGMMPNTCRFVTRNTLFSKKSAVEKEDMLVVTDGANLKITGSLTVMGTLIVHSGAQITVMNGGQLILKKTAIMVADGTVAVSRGGKLRNYGYLQTLGKVAVKGVLKTYARGTLAYYQQPSAYSGGSIVGESEQISGAPLYYVDEFETLAGQKLDIFDESSGRTVYVPADESRALVRSSEAVLYKYSQTLYSPVYPDGDTEIDDYLYKQRYEIGLLGDKTAEYPVFFVTVDGSRVVLTVSGKDGATTADIYKTCRGAQNIELVSSFFDEE